MYGAITLDNKEDLSRYITDEQIMQHYFGEFEIDKWYKSPFREEKQSSFKISYWNDKLVWRDFGISNRPKYVLEYLVYKFDISYRDALVKVYDDIIKNNPNFVKSKVVIPSSNQKFVHCKIWNLKDKDFEYWDLGKIPRKEIIEKYTVYAGEVWNNKLQLHKHTISDPFYIYLFDRSTKCWKAYRPYSRGKQLKFFGNNVVDHIQGYNLLNFDSDILFITKSYKDIMVLNQLGYDAIAPHSENMFLDPWVLDYLKIKYKYIYILYDNDSTGIKKSIEFSDLYNLNYVNIPNRLSTSTKIVKDPWDVVVNYNYKLLDDILIDKFIRDGV